MIHLVRIGCLAGAIALAAGCHGGTSSSESRDRTSTTAAPVATPSLPVAPTTAPTTTGPAPAPSGTVLAHEDDHAVLARRPAGGGPITIECHDELNAANAFLQGPTPAAAQPAEVQ